MTACVTPPRARLLGTGRDPSPSRDLARPSPRPGAHVANPRATIARDGTARALRRIRHVADALAPRSMSAALSPVWRAAVLKAIKKNDVRANRPFALTRSRHSALVGPVRALAPTRTPPTRPAIATQPLTPHRPPPACSHPQKHMPYAKYIQLATVKPNGRPSNRTVVFRGFLGATRTPTSTRLPAIPTLPSRPPIRRNFFAHDHRPNRFPRHFPCFRRRDAEHHRRDGSAQQQGGGD